MVRVVELPTGSGKTWIQGLIAKYYCLQNKKVTIIEPNKNLRNQTNLMLEAIDFNI